MDAPAASLGMMPPEILHEIAFGAGQVYGGACALDAADVAALRATCRHLAHCFSPGGLDLEYWYALGGADWCVKKRRIRALELALFRFGRPPPVFAAKAMALFCTRGRLRLVGRMLDNSEAPLYAVTAGPRRSDPALALFGERVKRRHILEARSGAYLAVKRGRAEVVRLILAHPRVAADPHKERLSFTILLAAAERGAVEIIQLVLEAGMCGVSSMNNLAACLAAEQGHLDALRLLCSHPRFDLRVGAGSALARASEMDRPECISFVLGSGWSLSARDLNSGLNAACKKNNVGAVRALLADPRADPNCEPPRFRPRGPPGLSTLAKACRAGRKELALLLLADPRTAPRPDALVAALESGDLELLGAMLQPGVVLLDDRAIQQVYETALDRTDPGALRLVLAMTPAVPAFADFHKMIILAKHGHMAALLEDGRVDPTVEDNLAIKLAAAWGRADLVRLLLAHGCDPTAEGCTAIRWAAEHGHLEIVGILAEVSDPDVVQQVFEALDEKRAAGH